MIAAIDFTAFRHPCLAVACPDCHARVGVWCKRPSGHGAMDIHKDRRIAADAAWEKAGAPLISQVGPEKFVYDQPQRPQGLPRSDKKESAAMTAKQYQAAIDKLGLSQQGAARLLGIDARTSRRYAGDDIAVPNPTAKLLRLMVAGKISIADVEAA